MRSKIIGVVLGVVIIGIAIFAVTKKDDKHSTTSTTSAGGSSTSLGTSQPSKASESLSSVLNAGSPKHCKVTIKFGGVSTVGDAYTDGSGNMHTIFTVKQGSGDLESNKVIKDADKKAYFWINSGGQPTGYSIDLSNKRIDTKQVAGSAGVSPSQTISIKCSDWTVNSSEFELPSNVTFTDFTSSYNNGKSTAGD
jgi:hypothetical protein